MKDNVVTMFQEGHFNVTHLELVCLEGKTEAVRDWRKRRVKVRHKEIIYLV